MASTSKQATTSSDDDEYEEVIVVADLKGVMDVTMVSRALNQDSVALRFGETDKPVVQIGASLFIGEWSKTLGTDIIYKSAKSMVTTPENDKTYEFVASSSTRLLATKSIVSKQKA